MFQYRFIRYLYNFQKACFEPVVLDTHLACSDLAKKYERARSDKELELERIKFGECVIDVPKQSVWGLFVREVLDPFYIFQLYAVLFWFFVNGY